MVGERDVEIRLISGMLCSGSSSSARQRGARALLPINLHSFEEWKEGKVEKHKSCTSSSLPFILASGVQF